MPIFRRQKLTVEQEIFRKAAPAMRKKTLPFVKRIQDVKSSFFDAEDLGITRSRSFAMSGCLRRIPDIIGTQLNPQIGLGVLAFFASISCFHLAQTGQCRLPAGRGWRVINPA